MARVFAGISVFAGLSLLACGQATRDGDEDRTGGVPGNSMSGGGATSNGVDAGPDNSSGGTLPDTGSSSTPTTPASAGAGPQSPACLKWRMAPFFESCQLLFGDCPADLKSYLAKVSGQASNELWQPYAIQGCGLVRVGGGSGFVSSQFVFNASGELVGYSSTQDTANGFCAISSYEAGTLFPLSCDDARSCRLARNPTPDALCACPCPEPATSETFDAPRECVFTDKSSPRCEATLAEQLLAASGSSGARIRRACGGTSLVEEGTGTRCDYDAAGNWLGASVEAKGICPGVSRFQTGTFLGDCEQATPCWLGLREPADGLERCVGLVPPVQ